MKKTTFFALHLIFLNLYTACGQSPKVDNNNTNTQHNTNTATLQADFPAFPSAEGFGANVTGGRDGRVIYVTNLNCNGVGSLNDALSQTGKKYILFKVSGIIDCSGEVQQGDCYIAGQTSPAGVILRGLVLDNWYEPNNRANNVIVRHITARPYTAEYRAVRQGNVDDGLRLDGVKNVLVDHCTFSNANDETVQISRSSNVTIQNCILGEGVGDHFNLNGILMNYSVSTHPQDSISIHHNAWIRIGGRMPEISCEQSADAPNDRHCINNPMKLEISNNLFWDIPIEMYYNSGFFTSDQEAAGLKLRLNMVNNLAVGRSNFSHGMFRNHFLNFQENQLFVSGNKLSNYPSYSDYQLFYCCNDFNQSENNPNTNLGVAQRLNQRHAFPTITYTATNDLRNYIFQNAGAFNTLSQRDTMSKRLLQALNTNQLDTRPVNGTDHYGDAFRLSYTTAPTAPTDTDADGMPDDWERMNGLNPSVQDHNGTSLSVSLLGRAGYTNLECYLEKLSQKIVNPNSTSVSPKVKIGTIQTFPNPNKGQLNLEIKDLTNTNPQELTLIVREINGRVIFEKKGLSETEKIDTNRWTNGLYLYQIVSSNQLSFIHAAGKLVIQQ